MPSWLWTGQRCWRSRCPRRYAATSPLELMVRLEEGVDPWRTPQGRHWLAMTDNAALEARGNVLQPTHTSAGMRWQWRALADVPRALHPVRRDVSRRWRAGRVGEPLRRCAARVTSCSSKGWWRYWMPTSAHGSSAGQQATSWWKTDKEAAARTPFCRLSSAQRSES